MYARYPQIPAERREQVPMKDSSTTYSSWSDPEDADADMHNLTRIVNNIVDGAPEILDLTREHSAEQRTQRTHREHTTQQN